MVTLIKFSQCDENDLFAPVRARLRQCFSVRDTGDTECTKMCLGGIPFTSLRQILYGPLRVVRALLHECELCLWVPFM